MNQRILVFLAASLLAGSAAPNVMSAERAAPAITGAATQPVVLTGPCAFFDGRQRAAETHFALGVLVLTSDTLSIHPGTPELPATVALRFAEIKGAALRRYAGERQVQIRTADGVLVIEMTPRGGQSDTDALMSALRARRVPFWDSGRFYRRG